VSVVRRSSTAGIALSALGAILIVRRFLLYVTVDGDSMYPALHHADNLLVLKVPFPMLRRGAIVVGTTPSTPAGAQPSMFVKRVAGLPGDRVLPRHAAPHLHMHDLRAPADGVPVPDRSLFVEGDLDDSVDSCRWGPVDRAHLLGVVVWRYRRPGSPPRQDEAARC
jgi:signal peptidase I